MLDVVCLNYNIILGIFLKMQSQQDAVQAVPMQRNTINRYLTNISNSLYAGGAVYSLTGASNQSEAWIFRDDLGAPHGIKGYEEQVNSVGMHHGHNHWPADITWNTFNSAT
jgi:hypothetical protein